MMASSVSNPRDLLALLLGELLYVERRLAGEVLANLAHSVGDEELARLLRAHLDETRIHVERAETAFRRLGLAPSAHYCGAFEAAVDAHAELAPSIVAPSLADVFHTQAALHTEHWEIASYRAILAFGDACGRDEELAGLRDSLEEEQRAQAALADEVGRLGGA